MSDKGQMSHARAVVRRALTYNESLASTHRLYPNKVALSDAECKTLARETPFSPDEVRSVFGMNTIDRALQADQTGSATRLGT